jgi:hypothetical protein
MMKTIINQLTRTGEAPAEQQRDDHDDLRDGVEQRTERDRPGQTGDRHRHLQPDTQQDHHDHPGNEQDNADPAQRTDQRLGFLWRGRFHKFSP